MKIRIASLEWRILAERTRGVTTTGLFIAVVVALALAAVAPAGASSHDACAGYAKDKVIGALGGSNRFAKPVEDLEGLQQVIRDLEPDIRYAFDQQDMTHVATPLIDAVLAGEGFTERKLERGEKFRWMAWRKGGEPQVTEDLCFASRNDYTVFEFQVEVDEGDDIATYSFTLPKICMNFALVDRTTRPKPEVPQPVCALEVQRDCDAGTITVDASGSSEGATVTMEGGPGGSRTIISGGSMTWSGDDPDPYGSSLTFVVQARNEAWDGTPQTCEQRVTVDACVAPDPACTITVSPSEAWAAEPVEVNVSGHWADDQIQVEVLDADGDPVDEPAVSGPYPTSVTFSRSGEYLLRGTATNEVGDTATCEASAQISSRWTLRPFFAHLDQDEEVREIISTTERSKFSVGSGNGLGITAEYLFSRRGGFEFGAIYTDVDSSFQLDRGSEWQMDDQDLDFLSLEAGANYHFATGKSTDFFLGAFVALAQLDDGSYQVFGETFSSDFDDEIAFGVKLGLDVPFGSNSPWNFHAGARYMSFEVDFNNQALDIEPVILSIGLAYDF